MSFLLSESGLLLTSATLNLVGDLIVIWVILRVHNHVAREHSIDADVLAAIKQERILVSVGIFLIVLSYIIEFVAHSGVV